MPQEAEAGKRFARDMRRIREAHHLSVGDLHDETKIPLSLIQAFEETGLFDHPQFNRVYLRSFVRTYANVVGVEAEDALEALEDALGGSYAGGLASSYLGEKEPEPRREEEEAAEEASVRQAKGSQTPSKEKAEKREPPIVSTTSEAAASYDEAEPDQDEARIDEEEEVDEEWAAQSPPSAKREAASAGAAAGAATASTIRDRSRRRRERDSGGFDRRWVLAGAMVIIVAVIVWILVRVLGEGDSQTTQPVAAADTVQTVDTTQTQQQTTRPVNIPAIGDTMDVQIIAAQGKVDPIRVTVDDDLRRPYWIEQGDSMAFSPQNRIVIEELLDNINLKVEGIEYPTGRRDPQNRIVITRDTLQSYFASLQQGRP